MAKKSTNKVKSTVKSKVKKQKTVGKAKLKAKPNARRAATSGFAKAGNAGAVVTDLLEKCAASDWMAFATQQRSKLVSDVKSLGEEIVSKIAATPIFSNRDELIREARLHMEALLGQLNGGSFFDKAIDTARQKQGELLSFLNIPSHKELTTLQRKLNKIEARVEQLDKTRRRANG